MTLGPAVCWHVVDMLYHIIICMLDVLAWIRVSAARCDDMSRVHEFFNGFWHGDLPSS